MFKRSLLLLMVALSILPLTSSIICNPNLPNGCPPEISSITTIYQFNSTNASVNDSQFLQGLTPTQVANLFTSPFLYNQTTGAITIIQSYGYYNSTSHIFWTQTGNQNGLTDTKNGSYNIKTTGNITGDFLNSSRHINMSGRLTDTLQLNDAIGINIDGATVPISSISGNQYTNVLVTRNLNGTGAWGTRQVTGMSSSIIDTSNVTGANSITNDATFGLSSAIANSKSFISNNKGSGEGVYGVFSTISKSGLQQTNLASSIYGLYSNIQADNNLRYNGTGKTFTMSSYGGYLVTSLNPNISAGTYTADNYGLYAQASGSYGTTTNYGVYATATFGNTSWNLYADGLGANNYFGRDNTKNYMGTSKQSSIYYNGSDLLINPKEVGSGDVIVLGDLNVNNNTIINTQNITPIATNLYYIGTSALRYLWGYFGNMDVSNNLTTGNFTLSDTNWDDITVPFSNLADGIQAPPFNEVQMAHYFEDKTPSTLEQYAFGSAELPHGWKLGTNLHPHIHLHPSTTNVGNATFMLNYTWTNIGSVEGTPTAIYMNVSFDGTANKVQIPDFPELSGVGKTLSSVVEFRLQRLSARTSDTFTGSVYVDNVGLHYEQDTLGSREELVK